MAVQRPNAGKISDEAWRQLGFDHPKVLTQDCPRSTLDFKNVTPERVLGLCHLGLHASPLLGGEVSLASSDDHERLAVQVVWVRDERIEIVDN